LSFFLLHTILVSLPYKQEEQGAKRKKNQKLLNRANLV